MVTFWHRVFVITRTGIIARDWLSQSLPAVLKDDWLGGCLNCVFEIEAIDVTD